MGTRGSNTVTGASVISDRVGMISTGAALAGPATYFIVLGSIGDSVLLTTLGGLSAAAGVALLAVGARRNVKYKQWRHRQALVPTAGRTPHGTWTAGVALRF